MIELNKQTQFNSLINTIDGINPKTLMARLQELERNDVIEKEVYLEVEPRIEYSPSEKSMALKPVLDQVLELNTKLF